MTSKLQNDLILSLIDMFDLQASLRNKKDHFSKNLNANQTTLRQLECLSFIAKNHVNTVGAMSQNFGISKPAVSRIVSKLIDSDYIVIRESQNKRTKNFKLTKSGQNLVSMHNELHQKAISGYQMVFNQFKDEELEVVLRFIMAMRVHLTSESEI